MKKNLIVVAFIIFSIVTIAADSKNKWELSGYDGIYRNNRKLSLEEIIVKDTEELGLLRNEIFARYGRQFKTAKYDESFRKKKWYVIRDNYTDSMLTDTDQENVQLILSLERPKKTEAQYRALILQNINYSNSEITLTFSDERRVLKEDQAMREDEYLAFYASEPREWHIAGDWVLVSGMDNYMENGMWQAYYLNHANGTIEDVIIFDNPYIYRNGHLEDVRLR